MKKLCWILAICLLEINIGKAQETKLLSTAYNKDFLAKNIQTADQWHPFPKANETEEWTKLVSAELRKKYIEEGEKYLNQPWDVLPVTSFLEFYRDGNRTHYEKIIFGRRQRLADLVMAETMEGKGRFTDDIINGIWAICEETFWGVPAHISYRDKTKGFPDSENQIVDLFAAETASLISWTWYLMGDKLDAVSPAIGIRMHHEVETRILKPCMNTDFGWMGFNGSKVNNWDPWICSNWLTSILIMENNEASRAASLERCLVCIDHFIDSYASDGGCDEGPSYWNRAGGTLYQCLDLLYSASEGKINIYTNRKIGEIGKYIFRLHICNNYFVNFADASAIVKPNATLLYNIGERTSDKAMLGFAAFFAKQEEYGHSVVHTEFGSLYETLSSFGVIEPLSKIAPEPPMPSESWLPGIQVCTARSQAGSCNGFFFAALGGNNGESHNHNDVGSFVLYHNGKPFIIDAGVGDYTAKTFSKQRYEIWTMQSAYHNLPTINGVMQHEGEQYKAEQVNFSANPKQVSFSLDIDKAYPKEAQVEKWKRTYTFLRQSGLDISDSYQLGAITDTTRLSFMTYPEPIIRKPGEIEFKTDDQTLVLSYPPQKLEASVEKVDFTDSRLQSAWKRNFLYRIKLNVPGEKRTNSFMISVRAR